MLGAAWGAGQPSGAALILLGVDARSVQAGQMLDKMLQLADAAAIAANSGQTSECEELVRFVQEQVPYLKLALQSYASDLSQAQSKISTLEQQLAALTKRVASLEAQQCGSRQRIHLSEAAFMADKAVAAFVMQEEGCTSTINELREMAKDDELSQEQLERWRLFNKFLQHRGWKLGNLCRESRLLKDLRRADAHSTPEEKAKVTLDDLLMWAGAETALEKPVESCKFLELVSSFGAVGHPLVPRNDMSAVLAVSE